MEDKKLLVTLNQRLSTLNQQLNIAISLLSEIVLRGERVSISDKVQCLLNMGLPATIVAEILNKPTNYVTAIAHRKKKRTQNSK